jgi:hypothetical protein
MRNKRLVPKEGEKVKFDSIHFMEKTKYFIPKIFFEIEIKRRCQNNCYIYQKNAGYYLFGDRCKTNFCCIFIDNSYGKLKGYTWICWNCFLMLEKIRTNFKEEKYFQYIVEVLKKRYNNVFNILSKYVCKDIANEILKYSEREVVEK